MLDLHESGRAGETHFHMNGFARRFVLRGKNVTRKWPIDVASSASEIRYPLGNWNSFLRIVLPELRIES